MSPNEGKNYHDANDRVILWLPLNYTILNAKQDRKELSIILRQKWKLNLSQFDYINTFGTTVSKRTKDIINHQMPQIFSLPTYPVKSSIAKSMDTAGSNLTAQVRSCQ